MPPTLHLFPLPPHRPNLSADKMRLSIRNYRNVSSTLQKLHHSLPALRHRRPTRFRLRILFQSPQISSSN